MADDPIDEAGSHDRVVIDLDKVRVAWGRPRTPTHKRCEHLNCTYSTEERRIWCNDCERTIDPFDGFLMMARYFERMLADARSKMQRAQEALSAVIIRRAAKAIDRTWGQNMAPCCPHCKRGLLPEDFANGTGFATSAELERARRARTA